MQASKQGTFFSSRQPADRCFLYTYGQTGLADCVWLLSCHLVVSHPVLSHAVIYLYHDSTMSEALEFRMKVAEDEYEVYVLGHVPGVQANWVQLRPPPGWLA